MSGKKQERRERSASPSKSKRPRSRSPSPSTLRSPRTYIDALPDYESTVSSEVLEDFKRTYKRLLTAKNPTLVYGGADEQIQTLIMGKFVKEKNKYLKQKAEFEEKKVEMKKLMGIYDQIVASMPDTKSPVEVAKVEIPTPTSGLLSIFGTSKR